MDSHISVRYFGPYGIHALLFFLPLRRADRRMLGQLLKRLHSTPAIRRIDRVAAITLPSMRP